MKKIRVGKASGFRISVITGLIARIASIFVGSIREARKPTLEPPYKPRSV